MCLHTATVPGGCTKFTQAADVVWNSCFKGHMRNCYDTWLSCPEIHEYTCGGHMKPSAWPLGCEWVKSSWQALPTDIFKKSFQSYAITTNTDSSDNQEIHCFKPGQPCEVGRRLLEAGTQKLVQTHSGANQLDVDPFASDSYEEEAENNEALIEKEDEEDDEVEESEGDA